MEGNSVSYTVMVFNILLSILGILGIAYGIFLIYSLIAGKKWVEKACKSESMFPLTFPTFYDYPFLNKITFLWFSIVIILFSGGLIFALIAR